MSWFKSRWAECPTCKGDKYRKDKEGNFLKDNEGKKIPCPDCQGKGRVISPSMM
jgi:DnaJ-class molecular chaperone